ncbi:MAG TPA: hypothetical protein VNW99_08685, partial [Cytophagaceae bacterium]|nr:hypothetical protein [Cytophagaceae bacterium]
MKRKLHFVKFFVSLHLLLLAGISYGNIYLVDNILDTDNAAAYTAGDGTNSLRKCIRLANANTGVTDNINFNIAAGPYVITTTATLAITDPVVIDGFTQTGASPGTMLIEINCSTGNIDVFQLNAGSTGSTIKGLVIYGNNSTSGIKVTNSTGHNIYGNYIGINSAGTGTVAGRIMQVGINLSSNAANCVIGGISGISTRNVISGNSQKGIYIQTSSNSAQIIGNYIGTNASGTGAIPNTGNAIDISASTGCTIGGTGGANTRNIISGNTNQRGIFIESGSNNATIQGNYIGVNVNGNATLPNQNAIEINNSTGCLIGGIGGANTANIISGNSQRGIWVNNNANSTTIQSNYIGVDVTGLVALTNLNSGIEINTSTDCIIGGTGGVNTRNVISGNTSQTGISVLSNSHRTTILGNFIGVNATGNTALPNSNGIIITSSNNQTIGGTSYAARNIISGNSQQGITVTTCTTLTISGNFIGLGADGKTAIGNGQMGINLQNPTTTVTIGGLTIPERNVISSNANNAINGSTVNGLTIQNNYIGTDSTGLLARGNKGGINISTATTVLIGGTIYAAKNLICNSTNGAGITLNTISTSVVIKGNFVGIAKDGVTASGNVNGMGISVTGTAPTIVTIGGPTAPERNIISSNAQQTGLSITTCSSATITNNYIGTDSTGLIARGNKSGISVTSAGTVQIGGTTYAEKNLVCNSTGGPGISLSTISSSVVIKGNFVGIAKDGVTAFGNINGMGVSVTGTAATIVTIGGPTAPERNIIASNTQQTGLSISTCASATIKNNYIGTDSTGLLARGNNSGINISSAGTVVIGGTSYAEKNLVCSSTAGTGITLSTISSSIVIKGNFVGIAKDGVTAFGNIGGNGILVQGSSAAAVTLGGPTAPERNIISSNAQSGVSMNTFASATIINNYIGTDSTGTLVRGNAGHGLNIIKCPSIVIGGTSISARNIISNNSQMGLLIDNNGITSTGTTIQGNYVGVDVTGLVNMG